jgi:hypothetical protein
MLLSNAATAQYSSAAVGGARTWVNNFYSAHRGFYHKTCEGVLSERAKQILGVGVPHRPHAKNARRCARLANNKQTNIKQTCIAWRI